MPLNSLSSGETPDRSSQHANDVIRTGPLRFPAAVQKVVEFGDVQALLSKPMNSDHQVQVHPGSSRGRNTGGPVNE